MIQNQNLKEHTVHGNLFLPFVIYPCLIEDTYPSLPIHWHEEMEIALIEEGTATYHINLNSYQVEKGDLVLISPHMLHGVSQLAKHTMSSVSLVFHLNLLGYGSGDACSIQYLQPIYNHEYVLPLIIKPGMPAYDELFSCVKKIRACHLRQQFGYELALKRMLFEWFELLFEHGLVRRGNPKDTLPIMDKIKTILLYIEENYKEPVRVSELARLCHFSEYHFMRFFKKYVGLTCVEYINDYRLREGIILLEQNDLSISQAALECGFNNISYFNRLFKEKYHMTPGEYRRKNSAAPDGHF